MERAYAEREAVLTDVMEDRRDWERATADKRRLAIAADAELRRRRPGQQIEPLRSAEPEPVTGSQARELNLVPGQPIPEVGQWIKDIAAARSAFAEKLAQRQACAIPREDPGFGLLGQLNLAWTSPNEEAILQPLKPQIPPSARVLERARERDVQMEAID